MKTYVQPIADLDLVLAAVSGDSKAFSTLYLRYVKRISILVGRLLHHDSECEEVIQDVFLQVHVSLPRFEGRSSFYSWIYRLAANVTYHHIRNSRRRHHVAPLDAAMEARLIRPYWLAGSNPEGDADFREWNTETSRVIDRLIPNLRDVMILGPIEGRNCQEMAKILGVTPEVIKARLHRARKTTRASMWQVKRRGIPTVEIPMVVLNAQLRGAASAASESQT